MALLHRPWSLRSLIANRMGSEALMAARVELWVSTVTVPRVAWPRLRGTCFAMLFVTKVNVFVFPVTRTVPLERRARITVLSWVTKVNLPGLTTLNLAVPKVTTSGFLLLTVTRTSLLVLGGVVMVADVSLAVVVVPCRLCPAVPPLTAALRVVYLRVASSGLCWKGLLAVVVARTLGVWTEALGREEHWGRVEGRGRGGRRRPGGLWSGRDLGLSGTVNSVWRRCVEGAGCGGPA